MKILLISPGSPDDIDSRVIREIPYLFAEAFFAPHAVAAVAALTPPEHDVCIHDEYIHGPAELALQKQSFDIIGISVIANQLTRSISIAALCKKVQPNAILVAGGIGVEHMLNARDASIDVIFQGEAESTWPLFLKDVERHTCQPIYKSISKPDMTLCPPPAWDIMKDDIRRYNAVSIQTTRGCPFDCNFCDVIYTYGRKPRSKTVDQVLVEIENLHRLDVPMVFFADDNFAGNRPYVKELLRRLVVINNSFDIPMGFLTQLDITVAGDHELLELLADANFYAVMIGIESVNPEALKEMNKLQNLKIAIPDAVRAIQSYGIVVLAHMIIGSDSDDPAVFANTAAFVNKSNILQHFCHPLAAPPGTKMWYDYKRQNRIVSMQTIETSDKWDIISNIIPKQMSRIELFEGLAHYWDDIYQPEEFMTRASNFIRGITRIPNVKRPGLKALITLRKMIFSVFGYYLFKAAPAQRKAFFGLLRSAGPRLSVFMPKVIYIFTCYLMDYKRSAYDASVARSHAAWERNNPDRIVIDTTEIPVAEQIRNNATEIFTTAYTCVREKISNRELVYRTVITSMVDYNDRFGDTIDTVDDEQRSYIRLVCERVLAGTDDTATAGDMPLTPPPGFVREILDALDNEVRRLNRS